MSTEEQIHLRQFAQRWADFGPQLDAMRAVELREQNEDEHRRAIQDVLAGPLEWFRQGSRPDSGLVEQQRLFSKVCPS